MMSGIIQLYKIRIGIGLALKQIKQFKKEGGEKR